jgi:type I restriction enzyme M protein
MAKRRLQELEEDEVVFLSPRTCGIYKKGKPLFKRDPSTGKRTKEVDNELLEYVERFVAGEDFDGSTTATVTRVFDREILVPRYFDSRWMAGFYTLIRSLAVSSVSLGELEDQEIISVTGGHGSPAGDQRSGHIPYVKVSDIRALRVNVNPTNLVSRRVAERFWRAKTSGLKAWDLITPNRASSNIGEFAMLLPGEESIVLTKEVFVIRVEAGEADGWDPFYLFWSLCLKAVRDQWQRITLMQTNREDVGERYKEILLPRPKSKEWAREVSSPFRMFFTTLAETNEALISAIQESQYEFIASVAALTSETMEEEDGDDDNSEEVARQETNSSLGAA